MKKLSAGEDVASYCTSCRLNLDHTIIAMIGDKIVKVKCNTCGSIHKYRGMDTVMSSPRPKKAGTGERKPVEIKTMQAIWETSLAEAKGPEVPYDMERSYKTGNIIVHNVFGKGVVQKTLFKKCSIIFRDKERLLITGNS